jgi:sporulation protein YabP
MEEKVLENHSVVSRDRKRIEVSGVDSVESFDEEMILLRLAEGRLLIEGNALHIGELSVGNRMVTADGEILSVQYLSRAEKNKGGLFRRK